MCVKSCEDMSGSTTTTSTGETRMLERRVSNNRCNLTCEGQLNYFLSWFNDWTELQRSDFIPILLSSQEPQSPTLNGQSKPLSLYACQVKLFKSWRTDWSQDETDYLHLRLKDIDPGFYAIYSDYAKDPEGFQQHKEKDYFEPGV
eukprot:TRINITY_DN6342_c0_g1_i1.p1 TRINITY_DN6342_c0_g1~~TRINITY_DN6342_c0_g1_i1.p1  ORF type:complete len:145 (+),score=44.44 TRINITY_DN6342_c0_g1_i1:161-595(+)